MIAEMLREELLVTDDAWTLEEVRARAGAAPTHALHVLVDRGRDHAFVRAEGTVKRGERLVVYAFDPGSDEDLAAVNALFSARYYPRAYDAPWPDERGLIDEVVPERGAEVLEICCGAGRTAPALVRGGNRVTAIDLSEACIERARELDRAGVRYQVADATRLPFADGSFDVACCFENSLGVFFSRRVQVVRELLRVARARVILGVRELPGVPDDELQVYPMAEGYIEVAQLHSRASAEAILSRAAGAAVSHQWIEGGPRPWGGRVSFLVVERE